MFSECAVDIQWDYCRCTVNFVLMCSECTVHEQWFYSGNIMDVQGELKVSADLVDGHLISVKFLEHESALDLCYCWFYVQAVFTGCCQNNGNVTVVQYSTGMACWLNERTDHVWYSSITLPANVVTECFLWSCRWMSGNQEIIEAMKHWDGL